MPYCTRCGKPIAEGEVCECVKASAPSKAAVDLTSFRGFVGSMKNRMGIGDEATNKSDWYERGKAIVPECVKPNEGEIPIKQYDVTIMRTWYKFMRAEGRMQLTNKRLIFRATGRSIMGRTAQQHEFALDEIAGVEIRRDYRVSFINIILAFMVMSIVSGAIGGLLLWILTKVRILAIITAILFGCAGVVPFFLLYKKFWVKLFCTFTSVVSFVELMTYAGATGHGFFAKVALVFVILTAILAIVNFFLVIFTPNLVMEIKTKGASPAIQIRRQVWSLFNKGPKTEFTGYSEVRPWKDTSIAMQELWPMINDIQKLGDYGIQKWKQDHLEAAPEMAASTQQSTWS